MDRKEGRGHVGEELVISAFFRQFILLVTASELSSRPRIGPSPEVVRSASRQ